MSIRLVVEAMDYAPATLTQREHKVLIVLAEDCRDETRTTWHAPDSPEMLRRARVCRSEMFAVLASLIEKGALERAMPGGNGRRAKYRIPELCPGNPDTEQESCVRETQTQPDGVVSGFSQSWVRDSPELGPGNPDAYPSETSIPSESRPPGDSRAEGGRDSRTEPRETPSLNGYGDPRSHPYTRKADIIDDWIEGKISTEEKRAALAELNRSREPAEPREPDWDTEFASIRAGYPVTATAAPPWEMT